MLTKRRWRWLGEYRQREKVNKKRQEEKTVAEGDAEGNKECQCCCCSSSSSPARCLYLYLSFYLSISPSPSLFNSCRDDQKGKRINVVPVFSRIHTKPLWDVPNNNGHVISYCLFLSLSEVCNLQLRIISR